MKFGDHCDLCNDDGACEKSHVYVIELDKEISKMKWFMDENPNYDESYSCLYVGKTSHHPLCRLSMHLNCKPNNWDGKVYSCVCSRYKFGETACKPGNSSSKKAAPFFKEILRKKLYKRWNPVHDKLSGDAEKRLTQHLREKGYGVWSN